MLVISMEIITISECSWTEFPVIRFGVLSDVDMSVCADVRRWVLRHSVVVTTYSVDNLSSVELSWLEYAK